LKLKFTKILNLIFTTSHKISNHRISKRKSETPNRNQQQQHDPNTKRELTPNRNPTPNVREVTNLSEI